MYAKPWDNTHSTFILFLFFFLSKWWVYGTYYVRTNGISKYIVHLGDHQRQRPQQQQQQPCIYIFSYGMVECVNVRCYVIEINQSKIFPFDILIYSNSRP